MVFKGLDANLPLMKEYVGDMLLTATVRGESPSSSKSIGILYSFKDQRATV
jgi:hypothetical protein